jgi:hypothetical protein
MTRDEVEQSLKNIGFELRIDYPDSDYTWIWLNGEMVGDLNDDRMELVNEIPSVVGKSWVSVKRRYFKYSQIANVNVLMNLGRELLDSAKFQEEALRQERVKNVREYFKYRNIAKRDVSEYNKIIEVLI